MLVYRYSEQQLLSSDIRCACLSSFFQVTRPFRGNHSPARSLGGFLPNHVKIWSIASSFRIWDGTKPRYDGISPSEWHILCLSAKSCEVLLQCCQILEEAISLHPLCEANLIERRFTPPICVCSYRSGSACDLSFSPPSMQIHKYW